MAALVSIFPQELIDKICYQFTDSQKSVCQMVCQAWKDPFAKAQYYSVHIRGQKQFRLFYESTKANGKHIRRLALSDVYLMSKEFASLPEKYPSLNSLTLDAVEVSNTTEPRDVFSRWPYLISLNQDVIKNTCVSGLVHLTLYLYRQNVSVLSGAKRLKTLTIRDGSLLLEQLEAVHQHCPQLTHLRLVNVSVQESPGVRPEQKAVHLHSLEVESMSGLNSSKSWPSYFSAKYPNLQHLVYWGEISHLASSRLLSDQERFQSMASITQSCQQLTSLYLLNVPIEESFFRSLDHAGISLTHLGLGDLTHRTLNALESLVCSRQNPAHLTLWGWSSLCVENTMKSVLSLIGQCKLTSLDFSMQHAGVRNVSFPFHALLNTSPEIEKLQLGYVHLAKSTVLSRSKLTRLLLLCSTVSNAWFDTLAMHCRDLNHLTIHCSSLIASPHQSVEIHMPHNVMHTIDLHALQLASTHSHLQMNKGFNTVRLLQTYPGTCLMYQHDPNQETLIPLAQSTIPSSHVSIQCASLDNLRISHLRAPI